MIVYLFINLVLCFNGSLIIVAYIYIYIYTHTFSFENLSIVA